MKAFLLNMIIVSFMFSGVAQSGVFEIEGGGYSVMCNGKTWDFTGPGAEEAANEANDKFCDGKGLVKKITNIRKRKSERSR